MKGSVIVSMSLLRRAAPRKPLAIDPGGNAMRRALLIAAILVTSVPLPAQPIDSKTAAQIDRILKATPLIDGHNDLPWQLREKYGSRVTGLAGGTDRLDKPLMTDILRLRSGRVGGQFWSVYIPADVIGDAAIRMTIEQIDIVKQMVGAYPRDLEFAATADAVVRAHRAGRIASLIGIEGGHQIGNSLAALRAFYALGARTMTLTHSKNNDWADSATDDPVHHGLTPFGLAVIGEMNRLGMLVDLSHVSAETMKAALSATRAPVIFTHSDARALSDHSRNVPDDVLRLVTANGGVVMVNFYPGHLSPEMRGWSAQRSAEEARAKSLFLGRPVEREGALAAWDKAHPAPATNVALVADHIDHVARMAGHAHVGIGADFDGIDRVIPGLGGVDGYPLLFAELIRRGWSDTNLGALAGGNLLRAMRAAEAVAAASRDRPPSLETLTNDRGGDRGLTALASFALAVLAWLLTARFRPSQS